jgi:SAM-dependent methyltransferase
MALALVHTGEANLWHKDQTAQAFWDQHRAMPYQDLLRETIAWCDPQAGETWLDLGCGGGQLTAGLWQASGGRLAHIRATDCAQANAQAIDRLRRRLLPTPASGQIEFATVDFSFGLPQFADAQFDGIVSGLAVSYAEDFDSATGRYTDLAYTRLFHEVRRILRPAGRFIFSVNVPNPNFWRIVWKSLGRGVRLGKPLRTLRHVWEMQRHGAWLKRSAKAGRFHFLPQPAIAARLQAAGFAAWRTTLSYADQAYLVRAEKE